LRSFLVEIYPPRLQEAGLKPALSDLLSTLAGRGIETSLEVTEGLDLQGDEEALMFRVAQEAVRNAAKHADPSRVDVRVSKSSDHAELIVEDNGRGLPTELGANGAAEGHLGLRLLHDLAASAGAALEIESEPGQGTKVQLRMEQA
jgi:signal transduction histidine kinase